MVAKPKVEDKITVEDGRLAKLYFQRPSSKGSWVIQVNERLAGMEAQFLEQARSLRGLEINLDHAELDLQQHAFDDSLEGLDHGMLLLVIGFFLRGFCLASLASPRPIACTPSTRNSKSMRSNIATAIDMIISEEPP